MSLKATNEHSYTKDIACCAVYLHNKFRTILSMKNQLLVLFTLLVIFRVSAQHHHCGVSSEDGNQLIARMLRNRLEAANMPVAERGAISYVPIHFHLVANSAGSGRHKEWSVLDQLCELNESYAPYDIQFYLSAHPNYGLFAKSISSNNVYENQSNSFLMGAHRHQKAINVYVVLTAASGNNQPGTTLAYYSPTHDWIVSKKDQINGSGNGTLPHEIGHFFSLPHTFQGWEPQCFDTSQPTWPKAPTVSPGGTETEFQNGTNCGKAGDFICDTPPDYNFGFCWSGCSPYTGGAQDPLGTVVDPMENNFMSYFSGCTNYVFTPGQVTAIKSDLNSVRRNYLDNSFAPVATSFTLPTEFMLTPMQNETVAAYNSVNFSWAPVAGATHYLLEADIAPSFISNKVRTVIVEGATNHTITTLDPNRTYYWRVRPFNMYYACGSYTNRSFKTPSTVGLEELPLINMAEVQPNPTGGDQINLMIDAASAFEMHVQLSDVSGRVVMQKQNVQVNIGEQVITFDQLALNSGVYYLSLTAHGQTETKLVSVVR